MKTNAATYKAIIKLEYIVVLYSFQKNDSLAIVCIVNILIRQTWAFILWRPMSIYSKILNIIHMRSLTMFLHVVWTLKKYLYLSHCLPTTSGIIFELKLLINAIGQNGHFLKKWYIQIDHYNFHILPQSDLKHDHAETVCSTYIN